MGLISRVPSRTYRISTKMATSNPQQSQVDEQVYLRIRRNKTTIFVDLKQTSTILELKKEISSILPKYAPENIQIIKDSEVLEDNKTMSKSNILKDSARAQAPLELKMAVRDSGDEAFEDVT